MKNYTLYVTEDIAKKAIAKGFECVFVGYKDSEYISVIGGRNCFAIEKGDGNMMFHLPSAEEIQRWLWIEKKVFIEVSIDWGSDTPCWYSCRIVRKREEEWQGNYNSPDEALLDGIDKALNII